VGGGVEVDGGVGWRDVGLDEDLFGGGETGTEGTVGDLVDGVLLGADVLEHLPGGVGVLGGGGHDVATATAAGDIFASAAGDAVGLHQLGDEVERVDDGGLVEGDLGAVGGHVIPAVGPHGELPVSLRATHRPFGAVGADPRLDLLRTLDQLGPGPGLVLPIGG